MIVLAAAAALFLCGFLSGNYFYNMALNRRHSKRKALGNLPPREKSDAPDFWENVPPQDVWRASFDGLRLHALSLPRGNDWIVVQHGYTADAASMAETARLFYSQGYSVLLPDARGHGKSAGDYIGMGWFDRLDLCGWIGDLVREQPDCRILLYGISMGGAAVMMTAGEVLPPNVKGIISDCGYSSVYEEFRYQLQHFFHVPALLRAPVLFFADLVTRLRAGYSLYAGSAVRQLQKARCPLLFIHGEQDRYVPFFMLDAVYAAAAVTDKQKLAFPGANHGESYHCDPARYEAAVRAFAARILADPAR